MHTVLVEQGELAAGAEVLLGEEERHHLRVRRAREGERVRIRDGHGGKGEGSLARAGDGFAVAIERITSVPPPPRFVLVVGAGDKERFGWLAEKAAELGVTDLVPLKTERTRSVAAGIREAHVQALQRRALQAIKQSGTAWAPTVHFPADVKAVASLGEAPWRWLADANGDPPPQVPAEAPLVVAVGPEGGLVPGERDIFLAAGFRPVRFAPDLLRFETAALAAAAVVASQRPRHDDE